jgi:hypothetical protein
VSGAQSAAAQAQLSVAHPAGRAAHANDVVQPPRQPGPPPFGQLAVAVVPAGHMPPSGTGVQVVAAQLWWLTQSWSVRQAAASPHIAGTTIGPSSPPASVGEPDEPQPTAPTIEATIKRCARVGPLAIGRMLTRGAGALLFPRGARRASRLTDLHRGRASVGS